MAQSDEQGECWDYLRKRSISNSGFTAGLLQEILLDTFIEMWTRELVESLHHRDRCSSPLTPPTTSPRSIKVEDREDECPSSTAQEYNAHRSHALRIARLEALGRKVRYVSVKTFDRMIKENSSRTCN